MDVTVKALWIEIKTDDPDDVWGIKQLPDRGYDDTRGVWVVPMARGLARRFEEQFPALPSIVAILEEREAAWLEALKAPGLTVAEMRGISAAEAIDRAMMFRAARKQYGGK